MHLDSLNLGILWIGDGNTDVWINTCILSAKHTYPVMENTFNLSLSYHVD